MLSQDFLAAYFSAIKPRLPIATVVQSSIREMSAARSFVFSLPFKRILVDPEKRSA